MNGHYEVIRRSRWFVWRDVVIVLLGVAVVLQVLQVRHLGEQLNTQSADYAARYAAATAQRDALQAEVAKLQKLRTAEQLANALKDRTITQLATALKVAGGDPVPILRAATAALPTP